MAIKPKFTKVWAETGVKEEVSEDKISQGWVAERPPYQHENWSRNRQDQMLLHINEAGIAVWDEHTKYGQGGVSYVKGSDGVVYQSTQQSGGSFPVANPVTDRTRWKKAWVDSDGVITIPQVRDLQTELNKKVDKVSGKQLSTNDYTTVEKNKLGGIESGAQVNVPTNLTNKATTTTVTVNSSTGNNTTILNATSGRSGVMTSTDKVKLDNLPTGVGGVIPLSGGGTGATTASGARTNLQLGNHVTHNYGTSANTVMMGNDSRVTGAAQKSANLSDLASASAARQNLGLGTVATRNVGESSGNVMQVGAFGLGVTNASGEYYDNLDNVFRSGFYKARGDAVGGVAGNDGGCFVMVGQNDTKQLGWDTSYDLRFRGNDNPTDPDQWSDWFDLIHTGNILTTTGSSTLYPMTQKAVTDAINNSSIGVGQTWQNMKTSRSSGTLYTNTLSKAIEVFIVFNDGSGGDHVSIEVGGVTLDGFDPIYHYNFRSFTVPSGKTYKVTYRRNPIVRWMELR